MKNSDPAIFSDPILEFCPEGIFIVDSEGSLRAFNRAMEAITGWRRSEVMGKKCLDLFRCRHEETGPLCALTCPGRRVLSDPERRQEAELYLRTKKGREIAVTVSYGFLPSDHEGLEGNRGFTLGVMREITAKKKEMNQIKSQAITDELTGLFNFRYFRRQLDSEIKRADRYHHPLSLMMLDIDHFKHYNDLHGHPKGNQILIQIARQIRENTRQTNTVARYGGEEFVILLPETDKEVAIEAAERLCLIIEEAAFPHQSLQPGGNLTVSLGVASYPHDAGDGEGLIQAADRCLYEAKREGRNRVRWPKKINSVSST